MNTNPRNKPKMKPLVPVRVIDIGEAWRLLSFIGNRHQLSGDKNKDTRDALMFLLMLDAGLRVGELVQLRISDLIYEELPVAALELRALITKNHRPRCIPLSQPILSAIELMFLQVWKLCGDQPSDYAFYISSPRYRISTRQVERILKSASTITLGKTVTPHMLRHTFATRLMTKTDIRTVQVLLGHTSLTSTQVYTHPNSKDMRAAIDSMAQPAGE